MQDLGRALRIAGIAIGVLFAVSMLWIVLLGPSALLLLHTR